MIEIIRVSTSCYTDGCYVYASKWKMNSDDKIKLLMYIKQGT